MVALFLGEFAEVAAHNFCLKAGPVCVDVVLVDGWLALFQLWVLIDWISVLRKGVVPLGVAAWRVGLNICLHAIISIVQKLKNSNGWSYSASKFSISPGIGRNNGYLLII